MVAAAVGTVLIGSAALARTLPGEPAGLPAGTSTSPEKASAAPSGPPTSPATAPPPAEPTTPPPAPPPAESTAAPSAPPTESAAPTPTATPVDLEFEAESADLSGFVRLFQVTDASGGEVVGMIGNHRTNHVRFSEVSVDVAGEYELTMFYLTVADSEASVSVNGGDPITVEFPGLDDLQTVDKVSVTVELVAGDNEIWFGRVNGLAPALDRVTVRS